MAVYMDLTEKNNLMEAIASSRMEGLDFTKEEVEIAEKILSGSMTLNEYFESVKSV